MLEASDPVKPSEFSRLRPRPFCLPLSLTASALQLALSGLNTQPACAPVNASVQTLRSAPHDSGSGWFATPFLCDSFIHDSTPVYPGALVTQLRAAQLLPARPSPSAATRCAAPCGACAGVLRWCARSGGNKVATLPYRLLPFRKSTNRSISSLEIDNLCNLRYSSVRDNLSWREASLMLPAEFASIRKS